MARITVYNPQGTPGTIEEGDTIGSSFTPDQPSGFLQKAARISAGVTLPPFLSAAEKATSLIPQQLLPVEGTAAGIGLGLLTPLPGGAILGGTGGGALGKFLQNYRQAYQRVPLQLPVSTESDVMNAARSGAMLGSGIELGKTAFQLGSTAAQLGKGALTLFSKRRQIALAQKARGVLGEVIRGAGPSMEQELTNLPGTVDLSHVIVPLRESITNPETGAALQDKVFQGIQTAAKVGDTTLRDVLSNPELASSLTPLQAQQVMNTLRQAGSTASVIERGRAGTFLGRGGKLLQQVSGEDLQLLQHANEIHQTLANAYPDAFPDIGRKFGQTVSAGRFLTPKFKEGRLVENILSGFRDPEVAAKVRETLPSSVSAELFAPSKAAHFGRVAGAVAGGGAILGGLKSLLRR